MLDEEGAAWARHKLREFLGLVDDYTRSRAKFSDLLPSWAVAEAIIRSVAPERVPNVDYNQDPIWDMSSSAAYTLGLVENEYDIVRHLGPKGPRIDARGFHPWVWDSASPVWEASRQDAVNAAARAVNSNLKALARSELSDKQLVEAALAPSDPKPGQVRLRFPGERNDTWASRTGGLFGLGLACLQGIHNVGRHANGAGWSDQEALEYLATLSVLARWIEECEPEGGLEPPVLAARD